MQADFLKKWASEAWNLMTAWWLDPMIVEEANRLINELGEEEALAEAIRNSSDIFASVESRHHWNKVLVCVSQVTWQRHLTF